MCRKSVQSMDRKPPPQHPSPTTKASHSDRQSAHFYLSSSPRKATAMMTGVSHHVGESVVFADQAESLQTAARNAASIDYRSVPSIATDMASIARSAVPTIKTKRGRTKRSSFREKKRPDLLRSSDIIQFPNPATREEMAALDGPIAYDCMNHDWSEWWSSNWIYFAYHEQLSPRTSDPTAQDLDDAVVLFRKSLSSIRQTLRPYKEGTMRVPLSFRFQQLDTDCNGLVTAMLVDPRCVRLCRVLPKSDPQRASHYLVDVELVNQLQEHTSRKGYIYLAHRMFEILYAANGYMLDGSCVRRFVVNNDRINFIKYRLKEIKDFVTICLCAELGSARVMNRVIIKRDASRPSLSLISAKDMKRPEEKDLVLTLTRWNMWWCFIHLMIDQSDIAQIHLEQCPDHDTSPLIVDYFRALLRTRNEIFKPTYGLFLEWKKYVHKSHKDDYFLVEVFSWMAYITIHTDPPFGTAHGACYWAELSDKALARQRELYGIWIKTEGRTSPFQIAYEARRKADTINMLRCSLHAKSVDVLVEKYDERKCASPSSLTNQLPLPVHLDKNAFLLPQKICLSDQERIPSVLTIEELLEVLTVEEGATTALDTSPGGPEIPTKSPPERKSGNGLASLVPQTSPVAEPFEEDASSSLLPSIKPNPSEEYPPLPNVPSLPSHSVHTETVMNSNSSIKVSTVLSPDQKQPHSQSSVNLSPPKRNESTSLTQTAAASVSYKSALTQKLPPRTPRASPGEIKSKDRLSRYSQRTSTLPSPQQTLPTTSMPMAFSTASPLRSSSEHPQKLTSRSPST